MIRQPLVEQFSHSRRKAAIMRDILPKLPDQPKLLIDRERTHCGKGFQNHGQSIPSVQKMATSSCSVKQPRFIPNHPTVNGLWEELHQRGEREEVLVLQRSAGGAFYVLGRGFVARGGLTVSVQSGPVGDEAGAEGDDGGRQRRGVRHDDRAHRLQKKQGVKRLTLRRDPAKTAPMSTTRRRFLQRTLHSTAALALPTVAPAAQSAEAFSFVLLGDLHYDKLQHHDMAWIQQHKGGDLSQIHNYTRITAELTPRLFAAVRESLTALKATPETQAAFILQAGDLVEGLCGSEELSVLQNREALAFLADQHLGIPFVFTKGNHDVTGDGAPAAFKDVFHPFLSQQTASFAGGGQITSANFAFQHANAHFCFFDAYDPTSLDWLEATLATRTARHCFVTVHPPVVPYGARSTWHLFSSDRDKAKREKLLHLLGQQNALVLGGHIHRFNTLCRTTPRGGRFAQLGLSSVINRPDVTPDTELDGVKDFTGDQIRVEPQHSLETETARRAIYDAEAPHVKAFSYANLPGHATITIRDSAVEAVIHTGITRQIYKTIDLTALLAS